MKFVSNAFFGEFLDQPSAFFSHSFGDLNDHLDIFIPFAFPLKMRDAKTFQPHLGMALGSRWDLDFLHPLEGRNFDGRPENSL